MAEPKLMTLADLKAAHRRSLAAIASLAEDEIMASQSVKNKSAKASLLQANVNEMCAATYTHLFRHYFPTSGHDVRKEDKTAIDPTLLARMRALEEQIKVAEEAIQVHRSQLPLRIRDIVQADFAAKAAVPSLKRKVPDTESEEAQPVILPDLTDVQTAFAETAAKIIELKTQLPITIQEAGDTIRVIEHAIKKPKAAIDVLMEGGSPATAKTMFK
ncbi:hypothetical protein ACHHYP_02450 [Achlya hypogyna]|uniref:Uncharacterized protein n=1 Tax=Achlya hypogyna TaxID=1202772 RepID=A0A1V9Z6K3_ACHHY|nr:hypothetical protein ACHHYP_02450 [Achlya hypogyna]